MTATDHIVIDGVDIVFTEAAYKRVNAEREALIESSRRRSARMNDWSDDCE